MELRTSVYVIATVFLLYAVLMLVIGGITYRKTSDISDFFLGGRNLNPWVGALSAQASDMSGWWDCRVLPTYRPAEWWRQFGQRLDC